MAVHALLVGVFAQTCVSMLPPLRAEIEWYHDGRPYALDVPLRATRLERVYRREHANGGTTERVLSCTTTGGVTYFSERVGSNPTVRIPVALKPGTTRTIDRSTVRRISAPAGASTRALWFSVSNPGVRVYGLQAGLGIAEIRTPSATGGFSILRGMPRDAAPQRALAAADSNARLLAQRISELEATVALLRDSVNAARVAAGNGDPPELAAIDTHLRQGAYHDALALLAHTRARIQERPHSGLKFRSLAQLDERARNIVGACAAARYRHHLRAPATNANRSPAGTPLVLLLSCAARPTPLRLH